MPQTTTPAASRARPVASQAAARERGRATTKVPRTLAECADQLYQLEQERALLNRQVSEIEARMTVLKEHVIRELPKSEATGIAGKVARVLVEDKEFPLVESWDLLFAYVSKTKEFDLLQRRVADAAVKERWRLKKKVPGVKVGHVPVVRVKKL